MKFSSFFKYIISGILLLAMFCIPVCADAIPDAEDLSVSQGSHSADGKVTLLGNEQLVKNCQAAVLFDVNSDTMLYAWNADVRVEPASLVKIMTAWIAVEEGNLSDVVVVDQQVLDTISEDATMVYLQDEEVLTLKDLLYCMMVGSGNDAAAVIAQHMCGSQQAFVELMNTYAANVGCLDTKFMNAHGLYHPDQYTTGRDVVRILDAALEHEEFRNVFGAIYYTVPQTNEYEERILTSKNYLMNADDMEIYYDKRVTGGRTGVTNDGNRCIASTAKMGNLEVICLILGSGSEYMEDDYAIRSFGGFAETTELLNHCMPGFKRTQVLYEGQIFRKIEVVNGDSALMLGADRTVSTVLPENVVEGNLIYQYSDDFTELKAPIEKGQKLSSVQVWYNGVCLAQSDLYAMNSVSVAQPMIVRGGEGNWWSSVLPVIGYGVLILAAFLVAWFLLRRVISRLRRASSRNKSRRYRQSRKRSR